MLKSWYLYSILGLIISIILIILIIMYYIGSIQILNHEHFQSNSSQCSLLCGLVNGQIVTCPPLCKITEETCQCQSDKIN